MRLLRPEKRDTDSTSVAMMVKRSMTVQALQARAGMQMTGEGWKSNSNRSLVVRSMSARLRTIGVLHIVSQKDMKQQAAHINVTYNTWLTTKHSLSRN